MKFSLWCDFVENGFLDGEFVSLITSGKINGATSNPAIFKQAILNSPIYKDKIAKFKAQKPKAAAKEIYESLAIADIQRAADKLALNFARKNDGFVSLEIDPRLYDNAAQSLGEAKRLHTAIAKPNVMMKIPATRQSYEVMSELMAAGVSVNATLIFSLAQAKACFDALNSGLKAFRARNAAALSVNSSANSLNGKNALREPQGVISVFVSRFDRLLNARVKGKNAVGVLNASLCYDFIRAQNEPSIRTLFASTGVKGDDLPKDYYIRELLFEGCINTAPLDALNAFKSSCFGACGEVSKGVSSGALGDSCAAPFKEPLNSSEIHAKLRQNLSDDELENACKFLLDDGLKQFCLAFEEILRAV